jgi:hypothetical protein
MSDDDRKNRAEILARRARFVAIAAATVGCERSETPRIVADVPRRRGEPAVDAQTEQRLGDPSLDAPAPCLSIAEDDHIICSLPARPRHVGEDAGLGHDAKTCPPGVPLCN